jgi:hypothetical protein
MLDHAQREPVFIEKSGRRYGVLLSAADYDALLAASQRAAGGDPPPPRDAAEFYARHKEWVDAENARFERIGVWNQEFRSW